MDKNSPLYIFGFASLVTIVCAVLLGIAATKLKGLQDSNEEVDRKSKILLAIGQFNPKKPLPNAEVLKYFENTGRPVEVGGVATTQFIVKYAVNAAGDKVTDISAIDLNLLDLQAEMKKPEKERRYPLFAYYDSKEAFDSGKPTNYIVPIFGYGLWSNCYGVIALDNTGSIVKNLVYYKHGETPGLGGEIEKESFSKRFEGKKVYDSEGHVALTTTKNQTNENSVQAISGATFTMDGVNKMLKDFLTIYGVHIKKQTTGAQ